MFGQEDEDFNRADCYLQCYGVWGVGGGGADYFSSPPPRSCGSAAWPLDVTFWPLIQGFCGAVVVRCGSGVTSLQQR